MAILSLLRKPQARKQGLKILCYGIDGSGKSIFGLGFPRVAVIDSESKLGVYEADPVHGKNLVAVADTSNYYDTLGIIKEVIDTNACSTLMVDSETNIYEGMQVSCMELEEERAKKKGGNMDDQVVSQRGYGKIKLNASRIKLLKAQASAKGITIIATAFKEDIMQKVGNDNVKVGEKPSLRKNAQHEYDVILRFFKEKDLATGRPIYKVEVEKDTTRTLAVGDIIESPSYELYRGYIEANEKLGTVDSAYDKTLEDNMSKMNDEAQAFEEVSTEFTTLFKALKAKDPANLAVVQGLLNDNGIDSYKKPEHYEALKKVVAILKTM